MVDPASEIAAAIFSPSAPCRRAVLMLATSDSTNAASAAVMSIRPRCVVKYSDLLLMVLMIAVAVDAMAVQILSTPDANASHKAYGDATER